MGFTHPTLQGIGAMVHQVADLSDHGRSAATSGRVRKSAKRWETPDSECGADGRAGAPGRAVEAGAVER